MQQALNFTAPERKTFTERVADYFQSRPGQWIDGRELETVGGRYAWRSSVSDCRTRKGMTIVNRQREGQGGFTISEYQFQPVTVSDVRSCGQGETTVSNSADVFGDRAYF